MPYTDSDPETEGLQLEGIWLHEPDNEEDTITQYRYGKAIRSTSIDTMPEGITLAGRERPIFDFGEHVNQTYAVKIQLPESETLPDELEFLLTFALCKKVLYFRDNRGRSAYGIIDNFSFSDEEWGIEASFNFVSSDFTLIG